MTTGSTIFKTTANILSVLPGVDQQGNDEWVVTCKFPWTYSNGQDPVYLKQSAWPEEPTQRGIWRVEVGWKYNKNRSEAKGGGKHPGTHYWMCAYNILQFIEQTNQMDPLPNSSSIWPGKENEAAANSDSFSGNTGNAPAPGGNAPTPTASSNGGHYDPAAPYDLLRDPNYGRIRGQCTNAVIAMIGHVPELLDSQGNPNWDMWTFYRDEFYNKFANVDITVYADGNEEPVAEAEAEEPAAPPVAPPTPPEHFCEVHGVGYNKYSTGYQHKVAGVEAWCHKDVDGIYDEQGNPVTDVLMI